MSKINQQPPLTKCVHCDMTLNYSAAVVHTWGMLNVEDAFSLYLLCYDCYWNFSVDPTDGASHPKATEDWLQPYFNQGFYS